MDRKNSISAGQLFCLLFVSHSIVTLTTSPGLQSGESPQNFILAAPVVFLLCTLAALPMLLLSRRHEGMSLLDCARYRLTNLGGIVFCALYGLYFLYAPSIAVARYNVYVSTTMLPQAQFFLLSFAVAATACYGAFLGLEALARASGFVFVAVVASLLFIFCALIPKLDFLNFTPPDASSLRAAGDGGVSVFAGTAELALPAVLLPFAKGKKRGRFLAWTAGEGITIALIGFFVTGVLGTFAKTQLFPFYVASTFAEIGALQRLDALYTAIWTAGLFVKVALFLISFSLCVMGIWGERSGKISLVAGAGVIFVAGTVFSSYPKLLELLAGSGAATALAVLFFTGLPLCVLVTDAVRRRRDGKREVQT